MEHIFSWWWWWRGWCYHLTFWVLTLCQLCCKGFVYIGSCFCCNIAANIPILQLRKWDAGSWNKCQRASQWHLADRVWFEYMWSEAFKCLILLTLAFLVSTAVVSPCHKYILESWLFTPLIFSSSTPFSFPPSLSRVCMPLPLDRRHAHHDGRLPAFCSPSLLRVCRSPVYVPGLIGRDS